MSKELKPTAIGTILQNRYQLIERIKKGGMGAIFKAKDTRLPGKVWAVKEMLDTNPDPKEKELNIKLFEEESRILSSLNHPNLPQIIDYFVENNRYYLVMEFVPGRNLEDMMNKELTQSKLLPQDKVILWIIQVCDALSFLHEHQPPIIFRDLKPANIMVTPQDLVKLVDFGVARTYKMGKDRDTHFFGTVNYASPEHRGLSQTDARSDIYCLGATMYHLFTGYPPIPFKTPDDIRKYNADLPVDLEKIIIKCMSHKKEDRYQTTKELKAELEKFIAPSLVTSVSLPTPPTASPSVQTTIPQPSYQTPAVPLPPPLPSVPDRKFCGRCGKQNRRSAKFCGVCGYPFPQATIVSVPEPVQAQIPPLPQLPPKPHAEEPQKIIPPVPSVSQTPVSGTEKNASLVYLGQTAFNQGNYLEAAAKIEEALRSGPIDADTFRMLGISYQKMNNFAQAKIALEQVVRLEPKKADGFELLAQVNNELKNYKEAKENYLKAVELSPDNIHYLLALGDVCNKLDEIDEAVKTYQKVLSLESTNLTARYNLGLILAKRGEYQNALKEMFSILSSNAKDKGAMDLIPKVQSIVKQLKEMTKKTK